MTYIEQAIKKAYPNQLVQFSPSNPNVESYLMSADFWQSLGRALGWGKPIYKTTKGEDWGIRICLHCHVECNTQPPIVSGCNHVHYPESCKVCSRKSSTWEQYWHSCIDHLAAEKPAEDFFKELLSKE